MRKIILDDKAVGSAVERLEADGIVMHPTETCYGLAVDVFNEKALEKLYRVKGMERSKSLSILVDSLEMAQTYGEFSEKALELANKYWPGPLAIIVPRKNLPKFFNIGDDFVSFRRSSDKFCNEMVAKFRRPVTTTSANRGGLPQLYGAEDLKSAFGEFADEIDLVVDGGKILENKPSTIVKVDGDVVTIIRQGDIHVS
ncbi:MAG: L-threonylcarbamoyladenylate synthase [Candidatus Gracilibacteria bacterium]|jgi:L-threonylcarbamoyladenylate synthase